MKGSGVESLPRRTHGQGNPLLLGEKNSSFLIIKIDQDLGKSQHRIVAKSMNSGPGLPGFKSHLCPLARFLGFSSSYHKWW